VIPALILICVAGTPVDACTVKTAQDIQRFEVPMISCGLAAQQALARQAGDRTNEMTTRIICGERQ
jgi:hypothetical protein